MVHRYRLLILALISIPSFAGNAASPAEEVSNVLSANVSEKTFLRTWAGIVSGADQFSVQTYVAAAVRMRPVSAPGIVKTTLTVLIQPGKRHLNDRERLIIRETILGALEVAPVTAAAVVSAAVDVQPFARDEILRSASLAAPEQQHAIIEASASYALTLSWMILGETEISATATPIGALNPENIDIRTGRDDDKVRSPEKLPAQPTNR